jgi:hypothetical protein
MGCLVDSGILNPDKTLTQRAKDDFIREVKELVVYGSESLPTPLPFKCGDPLPPSEGLTLESFDIENEEKYPSIHRDVIKNKYEKFAAALDVESAQSLLPLLADPIALAGKFGVELPEIPFPDGFLPYFSGLLLPKFVLDLIKAGVVDYSLPPLLAAKLPDFISLPSPPNIQPLIPAFAPPVVGVAPPIPEIPAPPLPGFPPVPELPSLPEAALADLVAVDAALATAIPKLLGDLIAEIPKLLLKLPDIASVFSDLCKKIRDSGVFGKTEPYERVKQAVDTVLSRKLMACLFLASLGSTIGVSKGSLGPTIASEVLSMPVPPKPPPTAAPQLSPAELVIRRARQLGGGAGTQYSSDPAAYSNALFYYEAACGTFSTGKISIYGFPVPDGKLPDRGLDTSVLTARLSIPDAATDYSPDGPNSFGVEDPRGIARYGQRQAEYASSCALFARACLYAGGAKNFYFLSQYGTSTAIDALRGLAILKNYNWVKKVGDTYEIEEALIKFSVEQEQSVVGGQGADFVKLIEPWDINREGLPVKKELSPYMRVGEKKVCYHIRELEGMAKNGQHFPALDPGDIILVKSPNRDDAHVMVVEGSRPEAPFAVQDLKNKPLSTLDKPINGYEGGQLDFGNKSSQKVLTGDNIASSNQGFFSTIGSVISGGIKVTKEVFTEKPTAIRAGRYDLGYLKSGDPFPGYYVAKRLASSSGGVAIEALTDYATRFRRIELIIKTNNFLELDNLDEDAALGALSIIDDNPILRFIKSSLSNKDRIAMMIEDVYPNYPRPKKK